MSSFNGHHAAGGPSPGGLHGAYSNTSLRNTQAPSQHMGSSHSKPNHPSSSSSSFKGISAAVAGGIGIKRVFATRRKKSEDLLLAKSAEHDSIRPLSSLTPLASTQITSKKSVVQPLQPLRVAPSTPPKHDKRLPSPLHAEHSKALNRVSVLPISPGISPAVNYMLQQQQETPPAAPTPAATKPQPQPPQSAPLPKEADKVKLGGIPDSPLDRKESKETWRKSDSTNSHHTIRPGGGGGSTRSSRPVSWAESFQSTHTIVQASNKRLSALITDGMPEEDDESFVSIGDDLGSRPSKYTPPSSLRVKNRRSMSLNLSPTTVTKGPIPTPLTAIPVTEFIHPFHPSSPTMPLNTPAQSLAPTHKLTSIHAPSSTSVDTGAGQQSQPSTTNNIRGRFAAWTTTNTSSSSDNVSRQDRALPAIPPQLRRPSVSHYAADVGGTSSATAPTSLRQTTISMTASGLGPAAAGLAKRAVEMGRKWGMGLSSSTSGSGSGYSSSSSSTNAPSSFSSASHTDYGLVRTSSNQSTPSVHSYIVKSSHSHGSTTGLAGYGKRRTPDTASGAYSVHSLASKSDIDPFASPSGPILGTMLRGGLRSKNGMPVTSGVVFGRELRIVTRETGVNVGKGMTSAGYAGKMKEGLVLELEGRLLPAIVVRCAQHLLIWGVQEEGLFRVSGRHFHVSKLRSEFDSGADYDMTECTPGDLDPHAVASVFKAYLRELPEPILTNALTLPFDAAIKKEASLHSNSLEENNFRGGNNNSRPPQGPKSGFSVRKPPSLSTLAMPTFSSIPPSTSLVTDIKSLVSQLPQENHDLLRTVIDLIKATAKESHKTKMPLSNLLLVLCPSLNMTPPLLRVLCEADGIWAGAMDNLPPPSLPLKDGESPGEEESDMSDASEETEDDNEEDEVEEDEVEEKSLISSGRASLDTTDDPSSGYRASEEDGSLFEENQVVRRRRTPERNIERSEIPTVYLDTRSHYSSSSGSSLHESLEPSGHYHHHMNPKDAVIMADDDGSISSAGGLIHRSSPPLYSSSVESVTSLTSEASAEFSQLSVLDNGKGGDGEKKVHGVGPVKIVDPDSKPIPSPIPPTSTKKASISYPIPIDDEAVQLPQLPSTPSSRQARRLSIPLLSLPNFSPPFLTSSGDADHPRDDDSPCPSPTFASEGVNRRLSRPSLRLLFSKTKKSGSSLNSIGEHSGDGIPFISNPIPQYSMAWESGTSDSSDSTPLSAVTAASRMSSRSHLPPVLDTPIEGSSLSLDLRFGVNPPEPAMPLIRDEDMGEQQKLGEVGVDVGMGVASSTPTVITATALTSVMAESINLEEAPPQTPTASRSSIVSAQPPPSPVALAQSFSLPIPQRPSLSLETPSSSSGFSISPASLSLLDDGEEDWTLTVLSAVS